METKIEHAIYKINNLIADFCNFHDVNYSIEYNGSIVIAGFDEVARNLRVIPTIEASIARELTQIVSWLSNHGTITSEKLEYCNRIHDRLKILKQKRQ